METRQFILARRNVQNYERRYTFLSVDTGFEFTQMNALDKNSY